ncbi:MAG: proline--tRNA ligase, partial [Bacteroidales bacterium]|nr:proline--tRNA ligase [Bacteroidales bacterium]
TFAIEAMMQDGKALQAGTSHFLGQNFAKAFDVKFTDQTGKLDYVWATSWGVSTRLIGALIMAHADNHGLVLPPKLAPVQVVIIPIYKGNEGAELMKPVADRIRVSLEKRGISVKYDDRDTQKPGWKFADYELKGVPVRIAIGPRDIENKTVEIARRDTLEKVTISADDVENYVPALLDEIQKSIFNKALRFREENTYSTDSWEEFRDIIENKGGFVMAHFDGTTETEEKIKDMTKATIRCIPLDSPEEEGHCILTGKPSERRVLFARAY